MNRKQLARTPRVNADVKAIWLSDLKGTLNSTSLVIFEIAVMIQASRKTPKIWSRWTTAPPREGQIYDDCSAEKEALNARNARLAIKKVLKEDVRPDEGSSDDFERVALVATS